MTLADRAVPIYSLCMPDKTVFYVYIMANHKNGTLYTGVTNNIARRSHEHKERSGNSFTASYKVRRLVYLEAHDSIELAIEREKRIKRWRRDWKIELIETTNPDWRDLYFEINK